MSASEILMDTGPLVAILNRRDAHHRWAVETVDSLEGPILTCEAVLSEAWFLARRAGGDPIRLLRLLDRLSVTIVPAPDATTDYLRKYANRTSVADAVLLALADADANRLVCTLDVRDFEGYRLRRRRRVPALMPPV